MIEASMDPTAEDLAAVSAVRGGDVERYRELVERHQRRVFAVAWSRLGDAALAEEAAQETFIRGYRRLWLLGTAPGSPAGSPPLPATPPSTWACGTGVN
jgi:DNA-directed RNA polymerase specialized sigma24 family protein